MRSVRIGCGSGFWGDSPEGARQLIAAGGIDFLVLDYLAEITMSLLARARQKNPAMGYAPDFVSLIAENARTIKDKGIKVVANAGGVNPLACRDALAGMLKEQGIDLTVAAVLGDDVSALADALRAHGIKDMNSAADFPDKVLSANAYLGGFPIAAAFDAGADIVITGRCVDSALALGPLIHAFGWRSDQHDLLAAGSLAGHVVECGPQVTGGIYTDWQDAAESWADIGYPIVECHEDGSFVVTKPEGTGGLVTWGTVAEQITYETGDPRAYYLPDVLCDFSQVQVVEIGQNRVKVTGARGRQPTPTYKVSATFSDGFRCIATLLVRGPAAVDKAHAVARAILKRTRTVFARTNLGDYIDTDTEVLGAEECYGANARGTQSRDVVLKIGVRHARKEAAEIFSREIAPATTGMAQGLAGIMGGRPSVQPVVRLFSFLLDKARVPVTVDVAGGSVRVDIRTEGATYQPAKHAQQPSLDTARQAENAGAGCMTVPLLRLAYGRSGDKGDTSNIAILARQPEYLPAITEQLTAEAVADYFRHMADGTVTRFEWPGLRGYNFVLEQALGGGGIASLRYDPQGKAHAQLLMDFPVRVPAGLMAAQDIA